jgi:hypothetical protein
MTQPDATRRTTGHTRSRPPIGSRVRKESGPEEIGVIVRSDDWYDTLQLAGVADSAQVLVEWPRGGNPSRLWEEISDLVKVEDEEAAK